MAIVVFSLITQNDQNMYWFQLIIFPPKIQQKQYVFNWTSIPKSASNSSAKGMPYLIRSSTPWCTLLSLSLSHTRLTFAISAFSMALIVCGKTALSWTRYRQTPHRRWNPWWRCDKTACLYWRPVAEEALMRNFTPWESVNTAAVLVKWFPVTLFWSPSNNEGIAACN